MRYFLLILGLLLFGCDADDNKETGSDNENDNQNHQTVYCGKCNCEDHKKFECDEPRDPVPVPVPPIPAQPIPPEQKQEQEQDQKQKQKQNTTVIVTVDANATATSNSNCNTSMNINNGRFERKKDCKGKPPCHQSGQVRRYDNYLELEFEENTCDDLEVERLYK